MKTGLHQYSEEHRHGLVACELHRDSLNPNDHRFLGCIPLYYAISVPGSSLNWLDGIALLLGLTAVFLEYRADVELHRFRDSRASREEVLKTGLWGWCRHPNYLGEIGFWLSLFLFGYAAVGLADLWMLAGPIVMVALFVGISIPMIEKKLMGDKPEYESWKQHSFSLLPLSRLKY